MLLAVNLKPWELGIAVLVGAWGTWAWYRWRTDTERDAQEGLRLLRELLAELRKLTQRNED
jgi:hypothetical protein